MKKLTTAAAAAKAPEAPGDEWIRWSIQLPANVLWQLKIRAAQERREIRETLAAAIVAYLAAARKTG